MRNKFFIIFFTIFLSKISFAENLDIVAKKIFVDKNNEITIFENDIILKDDDNLIKSEFAKFNKKLNFFTLRDNILIEDKHGNKLYSDYATYDKNKKIFKSIGKTKVITSENYNVNTEDVFLNLQEEFIVSNRSSIINDPDGNIINLENFEYQTKENIFKSVGNIDIKDKSNNSYNFSQIYLDEKKKEIIGADSKAFLNQEDFKIDKRNKPRIFSNTVSIKDQQTTFYKSVFTLCDYRDKEKCPPWQLVSKEMRHDNKTKTIYHNNLVIKFFKMPIFYIPKLAHPDPSVKRRSGFLSPSYTDTKNLGSGINVPYFWAISENKDLTINNRLFASENPLFVGEYRHVFKNSDLEANFGYTEGYKKETSTKRKGNKLHFFSKFKKNIIGKKTDNNLEINLQHVSNKKYLKLYKIDSNLVNYETGTLENTVDFSSYNDEKNLFFDFKTSVFTSLADTYSDKYEYILPEVNLTKNLYVNNFGYGDINSNVKIHNYETNKTEKFFSNNLNWTFERPFSEKLHNGKILTSIKNLNYENKNISSYKNDMTSEFFGAIGYLASLDLYKSDKPNDNQYLKPKILFRTAPKNMKKESGDFYLHNKDIFSIDRLGSSGNMESGSSLTLGFDYEKNNKDNELNFSIGQIINEKKSNKRMPSASSLDKRFSDIIGNMNYSNKENFKVNYDFNLDQNYKEMRYNKVDAEYDTGRISFNLKYLEEEKTLTNNEYIKSSLQFKKGNSSVISFENKRDLINSSSDYYRLSYEYINDCLRAGLVYRREFYDDSELEPENSLMFKITLSPFGSITSPSFSQ